MPIIIVRTPAKNAGNDFNNMSLLFAIILIARLKSPQSYEYHIDILLLKKMQILRNDKVVGHLSVSKNEEYSSTDYRPNIYDIFVTSYCYN